MTMNSPKNVFLIVMDTAQKNSLSAYGYERETTPYLNKFGSENTTFTNAVSQAPWTLPSHASMFTGKYPSEHGAIQENPYLEPQDTLASILGDNGYETAVFSANAWISPHTGLAHGFDTRENFLGNVPTPLEKLTSKGWRYINEKKYLKQLTTSITQFISWVHKEVMGQTYDSYTPEIMGSAENFIQNNEGSKFVCLNLLDPHVPYEPPFEYIQRLQDIEERPDVCLDSKEYNAGAVDISEEEWSQIKLLYDAEILYMDEQIQGFIEFLKEEDEYEDSLIIICSDHGELHGEHGIYGHEFGLYEELINVPLMIKHPNRKSSDTDDPVELLDLFHTILEFSEVESDHFAPERSIFNEEYRSEQSEVLPYPEYTFSEYSKPLIALNEIEKIAKKDGRSIPENSKYRSSMSVVRDNNGKYIFRSETNDEFFHFENARVENENVIEKESKTVQRYIEILDEHERTGDIDVESLGAEMIDDSIKDRLNDLGYLN